GAPAVGRLRGVGRRGPRGPLADRDARVHGGRELRRREPVPRAPARDEGRADGRAPDRSPQGARIPCLPGGAGRARGRAVRDLAEPRAGEHLDRAVLGRTGDATMRGPKAVSVDERGEDDGFVVQPGWLAEMTPAGETRIVVSVPCDELPRVHAALCAALAPPI